VNAFDERTLRRRLNAALGSLEVSPAPVIAVTRRGRTVRARRRALAGGVAAAAAAAVLAANFAAARAPARNGVTLNAPNSSAPNGVFASGTANGKPWQLAVRNIASHIGGPWCLPAVMLNGHNGDMLFPAGSGVDGFANPAILANIPGLPGIGAAFTQVPPQVTRLLVYLPGDRQLSVRPVRVSACGQRFHLAGFVFADPRRGVSQIMTYSRSRFYDGLVMGKLSAGTGFAAGVWTNHDYSRADLAASWAHNTIGQGTVAGQRWYVDSSLGLLGQCYRATVRRGRSYFECLPVAAPPRTIALDYVPLQGGYTQFTGYAGLVSPRTAKITVTFSGAPDQTIRPVNVTGRAYVAFAVPPGCDVIRIRLADSAGHTFASTSLPPPP
jgi:hypothetical protein